MGEVSNYLNLIEDDHEKVIELEEQIIMLRRMIERIGKEKRACMVERIIPLAWIIAFSCVIVGITWMIRIYFLWVKGF